MPSTYSPSLKLELIASGEQSGTWGLTTNNNLGTLLEQAITGVQAISLIDADHTLSDFNGISDEARNAVLVVSGTLTAARNITIPSANKLYIVNNATTGNYAINITTASGAAFAVNNGLKQIVYCDGANVYGVNPNITSATGSMVIPAGTTGNRDISPLVGYFRFNTTTNSYEGAKQTAGAVITTIVRTGTLATALTATNHNLVNGNIIQVTGATDSLYNGEYVITVTTPTNFTYVMSGTPAVSPTTGTPVYVQIYWGSVGGGGATGGTVGGVTNDVFYENSQTVTATYTITSGKSAMSTGPITVNSDIIITVPTGSRWVIL